jgi:hypothetical protein
MVSLTKISVERLNFSIRLKQSLESVHHLRPSPTALAREFNRHFVGKPVTVHAARKWLVGEAIPTQDKLRILARWLDVSVDWLRFGDTNNQSVNVATDDVSITQSPQQNLVRLFLALPLRERKLTHDFVNMLLEKKRSQLQITSPMPELIDHY